MNLGRLSLASTAILVYDVKEIIVSRLPWLTDKWQIRATVTNTLAYHLIVQISLN